MGSLVARFFSRLIKHGSLVVVDVAGQRQTFGDGTGEQFVIKLHDADVMVQVAMNPELRFGELYMDGRWTMEEGSLAGLLTVVFAEVSRSGREVAGWRGVVYGAMKRHQQRNTARAARRNASHHYDVGNDIYALFLDEDWQYSCAYFASPNHTLDEAQRAKKRHIAAKLLLEEGLRVLDIGCGWGGMGLYLADNTGADVTGITLADEQASRANARAAGRSDVRFRIEDYRNVNETFDRIVSVGMFEHVGVGYYDAYFAACHRLLNDDGVMLLHSIGRNRPPAYTAPFIAKYIFPGGYIPSLSEVLPAIERAGLYVTDMETLRLHYAETLNAWNARFTAAKDRVLALKDARFFLMWQFYLAASEAAFRCGDMMVFQIQLAKRQDAVPLTRDYMETAERALQARDSGRVRSPALVVRRG